MWGVSDDGTGTDNSVFAFAEGIGEEGGTGVRGLEQPAFLPMTLAECARLGWEELDVIIVTGDAYVDHPAFGAAVIGRVLVGAGYRTGIIAQPDWRDPSAFMVLGRPRLFFGVTAGNLDSMVCHYTAQRKLRHDDAFTPGGRAGKRPDRACVIYAQMLRRCFKGVRIVLGGIEASLRRLPHYDYWSDTVRNSVLLDAKADALVYGMGERGVLELARGLAAGKEIEELADTRGVVTTTREIRVRDAVLLPPFEKVREAGAFFEYDHLVRSRYEEQVLYMPHGGRYLRHNPPAAPFTTEELDAIYALPFARRPHPSYKERIPAYEQIKDSMVSHRGCFGGCHFCALAMHQGKTIQSRSEASLVAEAERMAADEGFSGVITDVGGPTANMYGMRCRRGMSMRCGRRSCLFPERCAYLVSDHTAHLRVLEALKKVPGVRKVFVASGVRHDLALEDDWYIRELAEKYVGGQLKLAPEHTQPVPLKLMGKPGIEVYEEFVERFTEYSRRAGKKQRVVPYILVGHPGTTLNDAIELARYLKRRNLKVDQVQEFTPTPMTVSTCMYFTGRDYETGARIHVPKGREVRLQKALVQWYKGENRKYVIEALRRAGREELMKEFG
ncbi:MAG: YgiQ family radical SAM protein [bacterium]|nr:YgiQ family radical SAM protein [bacterium]